jgi:hypothetical protein
MELREHKQVATNATAQHPYEEYIKEMMMLEERLSKD